MDSIYHVDKIKQKEQLTSEIYINLYEYRER